MGTRERIKKHRQEEPKKTDEPAVNLVGKVIRCVVAVYGSFIGHVFLVRFGRVIEHTANGLIGGRLRTPAASG